MFGTVACQTISSTDETRDFLELAARTDFVWGVVGWVDLTSARVGDDLDALIGGTGGDRLVGIPHQVPHEGDPRWLCLADVCPGLEAGAEARPALYLRWRVPHLPAPTPT